MSYINFTEARFVKDLRGLFFTGELKRDTVFTVDEDDSDVITIIDQENTKTQKYLRLYLYEGEDVPSTGFSYDEEQRLAFITYNILDRFSGQGFSGNSQSFLSQVDGEIYISEGLLTLLKKKAGDEGLGNPQPEILPVLAKSLTTLPEVIGYVKGVRAANADCKGKLCNVALHIDERYSEDGAELFDHYIDLVDLLLKSGASRNEANDVVRLALEQNKSNPAILANNGLAVWDETVFVKITVKDTSGLRFPSSTLFDVYEPRKVLQEVLAHQEGYDSSNQNAHVFDFEPAKIWAGPLTMEPFGDVQLFTTYMDIHRRPLGEHIEKVLTAIDVETCLQGEPTSYRSYFTSMGKDPNKVSLTPNNLVHNPFKGCYNTQIKSGQLVHDLGNGLYITIK